MKYCIQVAPSPDPRDFVIDGAGVVPNGESFAEWMRIQDDVGTHWTVISDDVEPAGACGVMRVVVIGRYV